MKHIIRTFVAVLLLGLPSIAPADVVRVSSRLNVDDAVAAITTAIEGAGSRVFTTVNFKEGSARIGQEMCPTTLIIFGSPKIGGEALQLGQTMALHLLLKLLAYEDEDGQVWMTYSDPVPLAVESGIPADHPGVLRMRAALKAMAAAAQGQAS